MDSFSSQIERKVSSQVHKYGLKGNSLLLAVSGGADSMALLSCFSQIRSSWSLNIHACYVHHGGESAYRTQAGELVRDVCSQMEIPFHLKKYDGPVELTSEAELRDFRHRSLQEVLDEERLEVLVTAHHQNDLLETRVMRLIRGVGPEGFEAMSEYSERAFRPLLNVSRDEVSKYLVERDVPFLEDPSNSDVSYLRNWIRREWLPQLEKRSAGSLNNLSRSFSKLAEGGKHDFSWVTDYMDSVGILRPQLEELSESEKRQVIASYLKRESLSNYTAAHVEEVLKRLKTPQSDFEFRLLKRDWTVDARHIGLR